MSSIASTRGASLNRAARLCQGRAASGHFPRGGPVSRSSLFQPPQALRGQPMRFMQTGRSHNARAYARRIPLLAVPLALLAGVTFYAHGFHMSPGDLIQQSKLDTLSWSARDSGEINVSDLPVEEAKLTTAPNVPPVITRDHAVLLRVPLTTNTKITQLTSQYKYEQWSFNDSVPGPFIRARVGDVVELTLTNKDDTGNPHNIDCHAFLGPGGGAAVTTVEEGETKAARFRLTAPGLYLYHCAAAPVPVHISNGMYGLMYVQPEESDLPPVDREYYVMQSEFYHEPPEIDDDGRRSSQVLFSYPNALRGEPEVVVFNGHDSALTTDKPLKARVDESVRIFFGNAGPNLTSSFHVIGSIFERAYRDGDVLSPPGRYISTVSVPPGGSTIVDMKMQVPGTYTIVDHAIFRLDKGAVGYLNVAGPQRPGIYHSADPPAPCVGCKLHP